MAYDRTRLRHSAGALFGVLGILLSGSSLRSNLLLSTSSFDAEQFALASAFLVSCWCVAAAAVALCKPGRPAPRGRAATLLLLLRALLCGLLVALLGWYHHRGSRHFLLMAVMQGSASVGAWTACAREERARSKSPPPAPGHLCDAEAGTMPPSDCTTAPPSSASAAKRVGSVTLPRGWRFHRSSGLFEHKRSGRLQWEPPSTGETGSPLHADLPPHREEDCERGSPRRSATHDDGHGSDSGSDSSYIRGGVSEPSTEKGRRRSRSNTWTYASRSDGDNDGSGHGRPQMPKSLREQQRRERGSPASSAMSVWELHAALGRPSAADHEHRG